LREVYLQKCYTSACRY